jgi:integrase
MLCNSIGRHLEPNNVKRGSFIPLKKQAGVPDIRFHDLRHTAATLLLLEGVATKVVSEMLGNASIAITLNTCSHVLPTIQRRAAAAMDRLFGA